MNDRILSTPRSTTRPLKSPQWLEVELVLRNKAKGETKVPAGQLDELELELTPFGLAGSAQFWGIDRTKSGKDDGFIDHLSSLDYLEVELRVASAEDPKHPCVVGRGIVQDRTMHEKEAIRTENTRTPVVCREYRIQFVDPLQHLWSQHFPCELWVDKKFSDILKAHRPSELKFDLKWSQLEQKVRQYFFALSPDEASFYDFVVWYHARYGGVLALDHEKASYSFLGKKPKGSKLTCQGYDLAHVKTLFPDTRRAPVRVMNAYSEAHGGQKEATIPVPSAQGHKTPYRHRLLRTSIAHDFDSVRDFERAHDYLHKPGVEIEFKKIVDLKLRPYDTLTINNKNWSKNYSTYGKDYRIRRVELHLVTQNRGGIEGEGGLQAEFQTYLKATLEDPTELEVWRPAHKRPQFPQAIEGRILSEIKGQKSGDAGKKEQTYQSHPSSSRMVEHYQVEVPMFKAQVVDAPFEPNHVGGHMYFPGYRGERVLLAMDFESSRIDRYLDWREGARTPLGDQGNQIAMGWTPSCGTHLSHVFQDKKPVFSVLRKNEDDESLINLSEGEMRLRVTEPKAPMACDVILSKEKNKGIRIEVTTKDKKVIQTIHMDGAKITTTVKKGSDKTVITQDEKKIAFDCKDFVVNCESAQIKSKKNTSIAAGSNLDLTAKSNAKLAATSALTLSGNKVTASSKTAMAINAGTSCAIKAKMGMDLKALKMTCDAKLTYLCKAAKVDVNAKAMLTCKAGAMANLKGAMVSLG